jgi:hypothetical protein
MILHQHHKKNEHIVDFCLSKVYTNKTFVVTLCTCNKWINNYCKTSCLSYIQVNDLGVDYVKSFASMLLVSPMILYVFTSGTEYWILKAFVENSKKLPTIIITSFNYIIGIDKPCTVPYSRNPKERLNIHYQGCSLSALQILLGKYKYKYAGILRYAQGVIFVKESETSLLEACNPDPTDILSLPNVVYGLEKRWPLVKKLFWVSVR